MSSNFENSYGYHEDIQPQNLSRYVELVSHQEVDSTSQDYMNFFPFPVLGSPSDENILLKRNAITPQSLERLISPGTFFEHRTSNGIGSAFNVDTSHHSSVNTLNSNNENYNMLSYGISHNPETYLDDRLPNLAESDVDLGQEQVGNSIGCFEHQFYPSNHVNSLLPTSESLIIGSDGTTYDTTGSYTSDVQTTSVLDLSPTVSLINRPHNNLIPYSISDMDTSKVQTKHSQCYSFANTSHSSEFKIDPMSSHLITSVKYEAPIIFPPHLLATEYSKEPDSSNLINCDMDHSTVTFSQPKKLNNMVKEPLSPTSHYYDRVYGDKRFNRNDSCSEISIPNSSSQYFDYGLASFSSSLKEPVSVNQERIEFLDERDNAKVNVEAHNRMHRFMNDVQQSTISNLNEDSQLTGPGKSRKENLLKDRTPVKKSERIMKAKASDKTKKESFYNEATPGKTPKRRKKVVTCKVCLAQFTERHTLKSHFYIHTKEHPFKCEVCGEKFTKSSSLSVHKLKHTGEKPHKCLLCGKSFRLSSTLKSHIVTHTGEKPFPCDICEAAFTQRAALRRHKSIHSNAEPFACKVCGQLFRDRVYFKKHTIAHELKAKNSCEVCGEVFSSNAKLQNHVLIHEGPNPYKCNKCTSEFETRKAWRQHKRRNHERTEELRCEDCDATFKRKDYFKAHKKVHMGDNLLKCEICDANFNNLATLGKHLKRHKNTSTVSQSEDSNSKGNSSTSETSLPSCVNCSKTFFSSRQLRTHRCPKKSTENRSNIVEEADNRTDIELHTDEDTRGIPVPALCRKRRVEVFASGSDSNCDSLEDSIGRTSSYKNNPDNFSEVHSQLVKENSFNSSTKLFSNFNFDSDVIANRNHEFFKQFRKSDESSAVNLLSAVLSVADNELKTSERDS